MDTPRGPLVHAQFLSAPRSKEIAVKTFSILLVLLFAHVAHANTTPPVHRAAAGDHVRVHLENGTILAGHMVGVSEQRILVHDQHARRRDVPRADVTKVEVRRRHPRSGSDHADLSNIVPASTLFGALVMVVGAPTVGVITYLSTRRPAHSTWEPAVVANDVTERHERLRLALARERRIAAPARPLGLSLSASF